MSNPEPIKMRYTNDRLISVEVFYPGFRTVEQFEAVRKIVESPEFDFSCGNNIFLPTTWDAVYQGPFSFLWYDIHEGLHLTRIGKRGKILREVLG